MAIFPATFFSWQFWLLTAICFFLFFAASRIGNKVLKGFLFWAPVTGISMLGLSCAALISYGVLHFRHG